MGFIRKVPQAGSQPLPGTRNGDHVLTTTGPKKQKVHWPTGLLQGAPSPGISKRSLITGAFAGPLIILLIIAAITGVYAAVNYYHDTVLITQTVTEGAYGEIASFGLPQGFNDTQQEFTRQRWINVTTEIIDVSLILSQQSAQVTYMSSRYLVFTLDLYYASDDTLAFSWDLLTDESAIETLATVDSYTFYGVFTYQPKALGTNEIDIDMDLVLT